MPTTPVRISVIVPAYNEARSIAACIDSLTRQTLAHELVIVDDGSTDNTAAIAEARGVRVLRHPHRGAAAARNLGAVNTAGEVLVFLDADMTFAPDFLERLVAAIVATETMGTFTRDEFVGNFDHPWARFSNVLSGLPPGRRMPADHGRESDVFRAIRRDAFERVGGYDDVGAGEDSTLARKLGFRARLAEGAVCWHTNPEDAREVFASARWYGRSRVLPHTKRDWLRLSPPIALARSIRSAFRQHSLSFAVFQLVHDTGRLAGFIERDLLGRAESR
jgi:glycosyltransferase involved in cell wall biosynthesis